jgi:hypothetical protein
MKSLNEGQPMISRREAVRWSLLPLVLAAAPARANDGERRVVAGTTGIVQNCQRQSARYAHIIAEAAFDELAGVFAPDGVLEVQGNRLVGRAAIIDFFKASSGLDGRAEHARLMITNEVIDVESDATANGKAFFTIYRFSTKDGPVVPSLAPAAFATSQDRYVRIGQAWMIALRRIELVAAAAQG